MESIRRGDVYWVKLDPTIGSEVKKRRPAIVVSNDLQNHYSSRVVVIPVTSNVQKIRYFEALCTIAGKPAKALADQLRTVDKSRLDGYIDHLDQITLAAIDSALKIVLALV